MNLTEEQINQLIKEFRDSLYEQWDNQSTQKQTLDYLCIHSEEIKSVYFNEL
ncbi:MAG: hypothetical protein HUN04_13170 [Desulfobacter sp.]|nr:MAG: hypothetical protein HUN04_13170 [Desulfobacter sp.]